MFYFIKTPLWLQKFYPSYIWNIPSNEKKLYLTFDDGPNETVTPFVLDQLKEYNAKATFFCIGKNVIEHTEIYKKIIDEGHRVGNHTFNHLNGWKTNDAEYLDDINAAANMIDSNLFRPPYGRITKFQGKFLMQKFLRNNNNISHPFKIIMWSVLSGDFDIKISSEKCLQNVLLNSESGSIVVFHDSDKAWQKVKYALPKTLEFFSKKGFVFEKISD